MTNNNKKPGRPTLVANPAEVVRLRRHPDRYTWAEIGRKLGVHADTAWRAFQRATRKEKT